MDETSNPKERRHFQRILFDAPVSLNFNHASYTTHLVDISLKGALVKAPTGCLLSIGSQANLKVVLNDTKTMIHMQARVAHTKTGWIGFIFDAIDMQSITHLRRMVELNLGDSSLLERELQALG